MARLQYQTVQISGSDLVNVGGPSRRGEAVGAAVESLLSSVQGFQDWAVRRQINQAVDGLGRFVNQMLDNGAGGVLICVVTEDRARPGGAVERNFRTAFIAGSGRNMREALNEFIYGPRMWQTPPSGFTRREAFIWVTAY